MSIYIKGMEMPKNGYDCAFYQSDFGGDCLLTDERRAFDRMGKGCPISEVNDHGDLIDFRFCEQNYEALRDDDGNLVYAVRIAELLKAPTIIPADKDGAE